MEGKLPLQYTLTMCCIIRDPRIVPGHQWSLHQDISALQIYPVPRPAKSHSTLSKPKLCKVREMVDLLEKTMAYRGTDGQNVYRMFNWNSKVICHVAAHVYDIS